MVLPMHHPHLHIQHLLTEGQAGEAWERSKKSNVIGLHQARNVLPSYYKTTRSNTAILLQKQCLLLQQVATCFDVERHHQAKVVQNIR
jgi:hypothetical protein